MRGQFKFHMVRADFFQSLAHDAQREFREVAFPAEMAKVKMAKPGGHDFFGGIGGVAI